ncbi:folate-binding protein [Corynebacterium sp. Q4381]|uniref:CAF17-like 4Fe-4S cluster assembly/insertion protein YgfZ n=1 Tax=Corynebacterium sp. Marseille-Q4381 TaxID=3121597 RepID=UPI002FE6BFC7
MSEFLDLPGAVPDPETGVALHYGDPLAEQRRLATTPAVIDRSHRRVVEVSGPDAPTFLNNLLTQKLDDAPASFGGFALDLDAQGRILHHVGVMYDGTTFYLDMPSEQHESFTDYVRRMVFWSDVTIEDSDLQLVSVLSPRGSAPELPEAAAIRTSAFGALLLTDALIPSPSPSIFTSAGFDIAGLMAYEAARVRAVEPEIHRDLDAKAIPHEVPRFIARGAEPAAVHLNKGCYRGQETVARVENLGRSPRLLVTLQLDGSSPTQPEPGAPVTLNGRAVGRLGTVVHDVDYGPIALALVKRSALGDGSATAVDLDVDGTAARVDPDSLPTDEGERAGRRAVDALRGR